MPGYRYRHMRLNARHYGVSCFVFVSACLSVGLCSLIVKKKF